MTYSIPTKLTGLPETQQAVCYAALQAFLRRHRLTSWGLEVNLGGKGQLDISSIAAAEFGGEARRTRLDVVGMVDLQEVLDMCLETHYNSCMNLKAQQHRGATLTTALI